MKLEKREITLNEKDSLTDIFYMEKMLVNEYAQGDKFAERKETEREILRLLKETEEDMALLRKKIGECLEKGKVFSK